MSFNLDNLTPFSNELKKGVKPVLWQYHNAGGDTITSAGYIPSTCGMSAGDKVLVTVSTASTAPAWYYASVSSGVITLTAC